MTRNELDWEPETVVDMPEFRRSKQIARMVLDNEEDLEPIPDDTLNEIAAAFMLHIFNEYGKENFARRATKKEFRTMIIEDTGIDPLDYKRVREKETEWF